MFYHYLNLSLDFLAKIAWPVVLLTTLYLYRTQISKFLNSIKKFSFGGAEIVSDAIQDRATISTSRVEVESSTIVNRLSRSTNDALTENAERDTGLKYAELSTKEIQLFDYAKVVMLTKIFDKIYTTIYGSQLKILLSLSKSNSRKENLKLLYDQAVEYNPSFYHGYSYGAYLNYLFSHALITEDGISETIKLTDLGKDFLEYIDIFNLPTDLPN